jgi:crotonobetainyl-CoA:carnitine CoA-transferase CaiB-like acyl-CoA transferase
VHNKSFYDLEHPAMGTVRCLHRPVLYDGRRQPGRYPPPVLGEHTDEILRPFAVSNRKTVLGNAKKKTGQKRALPR